MERKDLFLKEQLSDAAIVIHLSQLLRWYPERLIQACYAITEIDDATGDAVKNIFGEEL
jgi:hypothetical protein